MISLITHHYDYSPFIDRDVKAKSIFEFRILNYQVGYNFIKKYHYLGRKRYLAISSIGVYNKHNNQLVGVATFSIPQGVKTIYGWFGIEVNSYSNQILELTRLCVLPELNGSNMTSFLLSGSLKLLKKALVSAVITLADKSRHNGSIYQVCNFKYYGVTDRKTDFYRYDGKVNPRGKTKDIKGVHLERTQKHRYCYMLDDKLDIKFKEQKRPKQDIALQETNCCFKAKVVYDKRFKQYYECPKCNPPTNKLVKVYKANMSNLTKFRLKQNRVR